MTRHKRISIVITTVFGFIYIMANAQLLPASEATAVRVIGILAAAGLLIGLPRPNRPDPPGVGFSRAYWLIVAAEVAAGIGGLIVLNDMHLVESMARTIVPSRSMYAVADGPGEPVRLA